MLVLTVYRQAKQPVFLFKKAEEKIYAKRKKTV